MPIYNYQCQNCGNIFDLEITLQEKEKGGEKFICPKCGSKEIKQNISTLDFIKNLAASYNSGGCCGGSNTCDISCKPDENNPEGCSDKKGDRGCCG